MAFVSETERKLNELSKTMNPLGPGHYFKEQTQSYRKECAPFQSTSRRRSFLEGNGKQAPGPGNYEVSRPFVEPNIKTVSNSQSIIVKINSTGTAQFKSVVERFGMRDGEAPGPGQYRSQSDFSPKRKSHSHRSIKEHSLTNQLKQKSQNKNYPTIPERTRGLTDAKKEEVNPEGKLGPAFYNPTQRSYLNSTSTVWGKDKIKRFSLDSKSDVGPGKYNATFNPIKPEDKVNQPSSHFKSNTVRTYFDSIIYKTNLSETAKNREGSNFKTKDPAPGQYETNISSIKVGEKPYALQFFGSTVERFSDPIVEVPNKKSKSFYNIKSDIGQNNSFNKSEHAFMSDTLRKPEFLQPYDKNKVPGPGHYREGIKVQKKLRGNKIQKFGSNTKRMFQIEGEEDVVGPGKYTKDSRTAESPKNTRFGQISDTSCHFKSSTTRDCFGLNRSEKNPFAEYDVSHYDLSKKIEKQKNFLENLKKIDVEKAAFESSLSRFPHYESKPTKDSSKNSHEDQRQQQLRIKQESDKVRQMILEANQTQVNEVKKNHFGNSERFLGGKKTAPPVGQYNVKTSWQKRSYNVKYSK